MMLNLQTPFRKENFVVTADNTVYTVRTFGANPNARLRLALRIPAKRYVQSADRPHKHFRYNLCNISPQFFTAFS